MSGNGPVNRGYRQRYTNTARYWERPESLTTCYVSHQYYWIQLKEMSLSLMIHVEMKGICLGSNQKQNT